MKEAQKMQARSKVWETSGMSSVHRESFSVVQSKRAAEANLENDNGRSR